MAIHEMSEITDSYVNRAIRSLTPQTFLKYLVRRYVAGVIEWDRHVDDYATEFYRDMEPDSEVEIRTDDFTIITMTIGVQRARLRAPVWYEVYRDQVYINGLPTVFHLLRYLSVPSMYRDERDWVSL